MEAGRQCGSADRALPDRRQLGAFNRCGLPVLPAVIQRFGSDSKSRAVRRRLERSLFAVQTQTGRSGRTQLENFQRPLPARGAARGV